MNQKTKIQLSKLTTILVAWLIIALLIGIYDHFAFASDYSLGYSEKYSFLQSMGFHIGAALIASVFGGSFLVFYVDEKYRDKSYGFTIAAVCIGFIVVFIFIALVMGLVFVPLVYTGKPLTDPSTVGAYIEYLLNPAHAKNILVWSIIVGFTQLFLQINNKFGHGVLLNFIKGRYRNPRRENRIFMFLDLKSSTSIAEALGNEKYHQLLKDFFSDITNPIIYNKGEIYQYVGDEVVISWTLKNGIENSHCVKCYFDAREKIQALKEKYKEKYGLVPEFKAGLHYGEVIAGEIGIIKRDITFSGDVLNTTSRIRNKCNELNAEFLASTALVKLLQSHNTFNFKSLGPIELEGKIKSVELSMLI